MDPSAKRWHRSVRLAGSMVLLFGVCGLGGNAAGASLVITEFMASNSGTVINGTREKSDWLEVFNAGSTPLSLDGWFLTDDVRNLRKWRFPATNLAASNYLIIFASGENQRVGGAPLHTNFRLAAAGGYLALVRPDGTTVSSAYNYGKQRPNFSYGLSGNNGEGPATIQSFFSKPTPGAPNGKGAAGFVGDPNFEPERGFYFGPVTVRVWVSEPGTDLVYTTDGSNPSAGNGHRVGGSNVTVQLTTTTILRAAAFKDGYELSNIGTHSYIFPVHVAEQRRPATVARTWAGGHPADFEMDGRVLERALPDFRLTNALMDLASVSIVMPPEDLWGKAKGLYANPAVTEERAASFEMLFPNGHPGCQENAGVSLRGLAARTRSLTPKQSLTVAFRRRYGASKLKFPVFPQADIEEFNALVLRANALDSWANSEADWNHRIDGELRWYRDRASYVRDQWVRDTQLAQRQPSAQGRFVHLYLNGFYWGIYNLDERIDEKFAALHLGGFAEEYDVLADSELKAGTSEAWRELMRLLGADLSSEANYQRLLGNNADGTRHRGYAVLLDATNLVDYMILHIYAGADDWPWHNWLAIRRRGALSTGFKFLAWDQEISINSLVKRHTDTGQRYADVNARDTPAYVYSRCRGNPGFRELFADRVRRHLFNEGALSVSNNIARYDARIRELDRAIVAESARWGDYYRSAQPYTREAEWLGTNQWMRQVFFPSNHFIALKRFRDARLYQEDPLSIPSQQ